MRNERRDAAEQAGQGFYDGLDELIHGEQDIGFGEALCHDLPRIGDLPLPAWHFAALDQMHQDGDVAGFEHIEEIFADPVDGDRHDAKPADRTPESERRVRVRVAGNIADAVADHTARARGGDVGDGDAEEDKHAEQDEREGPGHQAERVADAEIPHENHPPCMHARSGAGV
jgi:hypothetical protein